MKLWKKNRIKMRKFKSIYILFIAIFILITSCGPQEPEKVQISYRLMNDFIQESKYKYGFRPFKIGGGFLNNVNKLSLGFDKEGIYNIEEARELLILSSQDFLNKINNDEDIRPYLSNHPFNEKNISFTISFVDKKRHLVTQENGNRDPNMLANVSWLGCYVSFSVFNEETLGFQRILEESYQEALEKVLSKESSKASSN